MEFNVNVGLSQKEFELIADAVRDKVKTEKVQNDANLLCDYMNIYDKASSVATLLKISEYEKAKKMNNDEEDYEDD
ncbi:hypothetical protein HMPREF9630_00241 [Peptoanaerobacter stomatis]|uniref:Uncharacterized protein n=1 Tax=Peptoanaerobacter stomatis TaxID=796937 RepID=V9HLN3_9FIRM|nr:hypothetical protein [Peptoanaerobacter stomatis]EHL18516.1 hypothetical protein HMPREF9630_00241 [Peptoanaerobacter stomatis]